MKSLDFSKLLEQSDRLTLQVLNGFAEVRKDSKEGNDPVPVVDPGFAERWDVAYPNIRKNQLKLASASASVVGQAAVY